MKLVKSLFIVPVLFIIFTGCAGKVTYTRPSTTPVLNNAVVVNKSKDVIWKEIIPALGKKIFVINNLDKESGIINISYSGDPEKYVDCGYVNSFVKNARGERTYNFPASKAYQEYETFENGQNLLSITRKMNLEGRMNIIVEEITENSCRVTVNCRYILTKTITLRDPMGNSNTGTDTISFNSGQQATFQLGNACCQPTGKFEQDILSLLLSLQ